MNTNTNNDTNARKRSRLYLVLVVLVFAAPLVAAFVLQQLGWRPVAARNYGELVEPAQDQRAYQATAADGEAIAWNNAGGVFHVVVPMPADCGAPCSGAWSPTCRWACCSPGGSIRA